MQNIFSDYIIFLDESGDHGIKKVDMDYPVFVLNCCIIKKQDYYQNIIPAINKLKFGFFGHNEIILHESDIRRERNGFEVLRTDAELRNSFYQRLNQFMDESPFQIVASVEFKNKWKETFSRHHKFQENLNLYSLSLTKCIFRIIIFLNENEENSKLLYIICESRGANEDDELALGFYRVMDSEDWKIWLKNNRIKIHFVNKKSNSSGLQLADLTARPIGLAALRPKQSNRAYEIIKNKIYQGLMVSP